MLLPNGAVASSRLYVRTLSYISTRASEQLLQHAREGSGRAHSLIHHAEAEQKRKAGHRWDRVESRIESLIQGRVRSRSHDFDRWFSQLSRSDRDGPNARC